MLIERLVNEPVPNNIQACLVGLVKDNAQALARYMVDEDSPIFPICEAEVVAKIYDAIQNMWSPPWIDLENGTSALGVTAVAIAVVEGEEIAELAGFVLFKPRLPLCNSASITYAVVDPKFRRQGVMRRLIQSITRDYPAIGLDCVAALVPVWSALGFRVEEQQGSHIAMRTAPLSGKTWLMTESMLREHPIVDEAISLVRSSHGAAFVADETKKAFSNTVECTRVFLAKNFATEK